MIPFERDVYIALLKEDMEKQKEDALQNELIQKALQEKGY